MMVSSKTMTKLRKTKTHLRVKDDPPKEEEPKIIAGFDSKAITPPIS